MAMFQTRITHVRFTFSPFTSESMMLIGQVVVDHIRERISGAKDMNDQWARPLSERYKFEKANGRRVALSGPRRYKGLPIRNWTLRGWTLAALGVKVANENRATIGPTTLQSALIIMGRNKLDHMWGPSPSDRAALQAIVQAVLLQTKSVRVVKGIRAA
jgi:hypothetical protein